MDTQGFQGNATDNNDNELPQLAANGLLGIAERPISIDGKVNDST